MLFYLVSENTAAAVGLQSAIVIPGSYERGAETYAQPCHSLAVIPSFATPTCPLNLLANLGASGKLTAVTPVTQIYPPCHEQPRAWFFEERLGNHQIRTPTKTLFLRGCLFKQPPLRLYGDGKNRTLSVTQNFSVQEKSLHADRTTS